jgi:hypothetical protein
MASHGEGLIMPQNNYLTPAECQWIADNGGPTEPGDYYFPGSWWVQDQVEPILYSHSERRRAESLGSNLTIIAYHPASLELIEWIGEMSSVDSCRMRRRFGASQEMRSSPDMTIRALLNLAKKIKGAV